ncbi:MAG: phosphatidate cytidylyltransferase [Clostridia bacterium]|nr:phosphatidate cytidylyltransferase [Clostridia bacterium]
MKTRIISALVIVVIGMTCVVIGGYVMAALVLFIAAVGLHEFYKAFENKGYKPVYTVGYLYVGLLLLQVISGSAEMTDIYFSNVKAIAHINWFPLIQLFILLSLLALCVFKHNKHNIADIAVTILGGYYVVYLSSFFISVRQLDGGKGGLYMFILVILGCISADTFAYFIGCKFGKHKLIPAVSPKKSVEGSVAAFVGAALMLSIYGVIMIQTGVFTEVKLLHYPILGLIIGGLAQIGDLTASAAKRYTGVKDFGKLIPGHGGILDRVDSYIFVFPIAYYYLSLVVLR